MSDEYKKESNDYFSIFISVVIAIYFHLIFTCLSKHIRPHHHCRRNFVPWLFQPSFSRPHPEAKQ